MASAQVCGGWDAGDGPCLGIHKTVQIGGVYTSGIKRVELTRLFHWRVVVSGSLDGESQEVCDMAMYLNSAIRLVELSYNSAIERW